MAWIVLVVYTMMDIQFSPERLPTLRRGMRTFNYLLHFVIGVGVLNDISTTQDALSNNRLPDEDTIWPNWFWISVAAFVFIVVIVACLFLFVFMFHLLRREETLGLCAKKLEETFHFNDNPRLRNDPIAVRKFFGELHNLVLAYDGMDLLDNGIRLDNKHGGLSSFLGRPLTWVNTPRKSVGDAWKRVMKLRFHLPLLKVEVDREQDSDFHVLQDVFVLFMRMSLYRRMTDFRDLVIRQRMPTRIQMIVSECDEVSMDGMKVETRDRIKVHRISYFSWIFTAVFFLLPLTLFLFAFIAPSSGYQWATCENPGENLLFPLTSDASDTFATLSLDSAIFWSHKTQERVKSVSLMDYASDLCDESSLDPVCKAWKNISSVSLTAYVSLLLVFLVMGITLLFTIALHLREISWVCEYTPEMRIRDVRGVRTSWIFRLILMTMASVLILFAGFYYESKSKLADLVDDSVGGSEFQWGTGNDFALTAGAVCIPEAICLSTQLYSFIILCPIRVRVC
jgi:hypothetical protein